VKILQCLSSNRIHPAGNSHRFSEHDCQSFEDDETGKRDESADSDLLTMVVTYDAGDP
jgi:hypothetical protein